MYALPKAGNETVLADLAVAVESSRRAHQAEVMKRLNYWDSPVPAGAEDRG